MPAPYSKVVEAPLTPPREDSAVNYKQLPENVQWLDGARGFKKRPGSLPVAEFVPGTQSSELMNAFYGFWGLRTPSYLLQSLTSLGATDTGIVASPITLLGVRGLSISRQRLFQLRTVRAAQVNYRNYFGRGRESRSDTGYYFHNTNVATNGTSIASTDTVGTVAALGAAGFTDFAQGGLPAYFLRPEEKAETNFNWVDSNGNILQVLTNKDISGASESAYLRAAGLNRFRYDAFSNDSGVFLGGGGTMLFHFDGFRTYVAGAADLSWGTLSSSLSAGALTGTYQYFLTHVVELPSGETIEGEPTAVLSVAPAAQNVALTLQSPSGNITAPNTSLETLYRLTSYTTSTAGAVTSVVINETHDLAIGEWLTFFVSGARQRRQIYNVVGQTVTLSSSITLSGTTYLSHGGGFRLYRTKAGGTQFYKHSDFAYGQLAAPFATDSTADGSLTVQFQDTATLRSEPPTNVFAVADHQGRTVVLATGAGSVLSNTFPSSSGYAPPLSTLTCWFSTASSRYYFPPDQSFIIPLASYEYPAGIVSVDNLLYIITSNSVWVVQGQLDTSPESYSLQLLTNQVGCKDPKSIIRIGQSIFFTGQNGFVELTGATVSETIGDPIRKYIKQPGTVTASYFWKSKGLLLLSANRTYLRTSAAQATIFFPDMDASSVATGYMLREARTLVYDLSSKRWSLWNIDCFGGVAETLEGDLLYAPMGQTAEITGSVPTLNIRRLSDYCNWTDSGTPFTARYFSEWYDNGDPATDKTFNRLAVFSTDTEDAGGQGFGLTIKTEKNWQPGLIVDTIDSDAFLEGRGYGQQPYGTTPYGDPELPVKVFPLSNQKVKSMRFVLENAEPNGDFVINGAELETATKYVNMKDE